MSTLQDLNDKFDEYVADRDAIDVQKDALSATKDAEIVELTQKLSEAGVPQSVVDELKAGIDAAVAREQAAIDALTLPVSPVVVVPPVVVGDV